MDAIMTGDNQLANLIQTFWSSNFFATLRKNIIFPENINQDYEGEIQKLGQTLNISQVVDFSEADTLPQGMTGDADDTSVNQFQLVINKRPFKDVIVEDQAMLQSVPFMDKLRDSMVYSIMRRVQTEVFNIMVAAAGNQKNYAAGGGTLTYPDLITVKKALDALDVPTNSRIMVLGSSQMNDIFNMIQFTSRDYNGGETTVVNGTFSQPFLGFSGRFTTQAAAVAYFYHPSTSTYALQRSLNAEVARGGWVGARATRINMDLLMGVKMLDNNRLSTMS